MIDKITAKIKRYPFQTGIAVGVLACLLLFGIISLFQDHGRTLSGNSEIIREDYLRMTINEYDRGLDRDLAAWRYQHLGRKADETLKFMRADSSVSPTALVGFAEAVDKTDKIGLISNDSDQGGVGTPANPRKGLSGVGKVLLIILGCIVVAAGVLYVVSLIQTKKKQKRRTENNQRFDQDTVNVITPETASSDRDNVSGTLFDLDTLFPQNSETEQSESADDFSKDGLLKDIFDRENETVPDKKTEDEKTEPEGIEQKEMSEEVIADHSNDTEQEPISGINNSDNEEFSIAPEETEPENVDDNNEIEENNEDEKTFVIDQDEIDDHNDPKINDAAESERPEYPDLEYEPSSQSLDLSQDNDQVTEETEEISETEEESAEEIIESPEPDGAEAVQSEINEDSDLETEKPLVETDSENETENEDELLKIIRAGNAESENSQPKNIESIADLDTAQEIVAETQDDANETENEASDDSFAPENDDQEDESAADDDVLIHYQSQYRIGNDMYDEVFSIDQGETFRGECGIGIGETLNSTEPKAVTAFELWLFDKDDIHTSTLYLMSDFALSNDGISKRLEQRGKCDRIRKGDLYTLETETLTVEVKILELEYGSEMEEKNSYFTNVVFDVIAKQKEQSL